MRLNPFRPAREAMQMRGFLYATDGREILHNDPDGWEISQPWLWWNGPAGGDGTGGPWGNPPPGANAKRGVMPGGSYCTNLIAGTLAGLPWRVQSGSTRLATPPWIADPQLARPDARFGRVDGPTPAWQMSVVDFRTQWITSALWLLALKPVRLLNRDTAWPRRMPSTSHVRESRVPASVTRCCLFSKGVRYEI